MEEEFRVHSALQPKDMKNTSIQSDIDSPSRLDNRYQQAQTAANNIRKSTETPGSNNGAM